MSHKNLVTFLTDEDRTILGIVDSLKGKQRDIFWMITSGVSTGLIASTLEMHSSAVSKVLGNLREMFDTEGNTCNLISTVLPALIRRECAQALPEILEKYYGSGKEESTQEGEETSSTWVFSD